MKRGAENQLTKDDTSDEEPEEVPASFKQADDTTLATRKIRGLPKRALGRPVPTTNGASEPSAPKFSAFGGFGASSTNSAFTFTPPSAKPGSLTSPSPSEAQPQSAGTSSINSTSATVSSTATNAAKTLASILGAPPDSLAQKLPTAGLTTGLTFPLKPLSTPAPLTFAASSSPSIAEPATPINDSIIKFYTELRGLNVSLLAAVTKAVQDDAFIDITQMLEQYKTQRTRIQDDYGKLKQVETKKLELSKPQTPLSMPTPPSSFSFGNKTFNTSSFKANEPSNGGGFKPTISVTTSAASSPFQLPSTTLTTSELSDSGKPATVITFGAPSSSSPDSSAFGNFSKPGSFKFTSTSTTTSPLFGSSNFFGSPSSSNSFDQPASTTPASTTPGFAGFGKPTGSGSIGNPVGFVFGAASSKESDTDGATKTTSVTSFTFGQPSSALGTHKQAKESKETEEGEGEEDSGGDDASAAAEGDSTAKTALSAPSPHDVEGEGEEDEETTHSVRLKAYRMKKADERGGEGWAELGVGYLRLKRHKETDLRRILLRNSSTGMISINFNLYSGLKVTQAKKNVTFIGHDNGVSQTYNVRLPNEDQARELKKAIESEVVLVKPR